MMSWFYRWFCAASNRLGVPKEFLARGIVVAFLEKLECIEDAPSRPCIVLGSMVAEAYPPCLEKAIGYLHTNFNDLHSYGELEKYSLSIEEFFSNLLGLKGIAVLPTYGASESTLTALYVFREATKRRHVIVAESAHMSVVKAVQVLGMSLLRISVDGRGRANLEELERQVVMHQDDIAGIVT